MALFALCFAVLALAAAGLGVGALRGRPIAPGPCRQAVLTGGMLPGCGACPGAAHGEGAMSARRTSPTP